MFIAVVSRPYAIVNITATTNDYNLRSAVGTAIGVPNPNFPINVYSFITANVNSTSNSNSAYRTGTGWYGGTNIYVENRSNYIITGRSGVLMELVGRVE
jgi:hypothetical protein